MTIRSPENEYQIEQEEDPDISEEADDESKADGTDPSFPKSPEQESGDYIDAPGNAGPYLPTQEIVHQTLNLVDNPPPSKTSEEAPPFSTQRTVQARGARTDADFLNSTDSDGGSSPVFADTENRQSKKNTLRYRKKREKWRQNRRR